jgi:hypothetical protein
VEVYSIRLKLIENSAECPRCSSVALPVKFSQAEVRRYFETPDSNSIVNV